MKKTILIIILLNIAFSHANSQSFSVEDLVTLSTMPLNNIDHYMNKNGYAVYSNQVSDDTVSTCFKLKVKGKKIYVGPVRSIEIYLKNNTKYFTLYTSSQAEYLSGQKNLIKSGFVYDNSKDFTGASPMLFQKKNITIFANSAIVDGTVQYSFLLTEKAIPLSVMYAEELLQFDSHEFLASFFGEQNVKKDMYFFSEKKLKKCSVLYNGTRRQAVFVWGDENNLNHLEYVLVTNVLPTAGAKDYEPLSGNNEWQFENGIHAGMPLKELLKINEMDFDIYGNKSDLAFMVKPIETGKIDFKKTAVMLSCDNCFDNKIFNQEEVSALDVAKANLPMRVFDVIIYPAGH